MHKTFFIYLLMVISPLSAMNVQKKNSIHGNRVPRFMDLDDVNSRTPRMADSHLADVSASDDEDGQESCRTYIAHSASQYSYDEDEDSYSERDFEQSRRPVLKKGGASHRGVPKNGGLDGNTSRNYSRNNSRMSSKGLRNGHVQDGRRIYSRGTGRLNYEKIARSYPSNQTDDDESYFSDESKEVFDEDSSQSSRPDFDRSRRSRSGNRSNQSAHYTLIADLMRLGRIKGWPIIAGIMIAHNYYPTATRICVGIAACIGCVYIIKKIKNKKLFEKTEKEVNKYLNTLWFNKRLFYEVKNAQ